MCSGQSWLFWNVLESCVGEWMSKRANGMKDGGM